MQFQEIGAILKSKREEKNITQQEIAHKLKIPLRGIVALEEGDLGDLPHETYVRTFTKEYAKIVGIDVDEMRQMLNTVEEFETYAPPPKSMETKHAESEPKGVKTKSVRIAVQLLLVALIGTTGYFYYVNSRGDSESIFTSLSNWFTSVVTSSNKSEDANWTAEEKSAHSQNNADTQSTDTNNQGNVTQGDENRDDSNNSMHENVADAKSPEQIAAEAQAEQARLEKEALENATNEANMAFEAFIAQTPDALLLDWTDFDKTGNLTKQAMLYVKDDCWMQVVADGKSTHFTMRAGNQRKFNFNESIEFKFGRASAVTLFHGYERVKVGDSSALRTVKLNAL